MSIESKPYSESEILFLRQNYHLVGPVACSQHLGRSYRATIHKATRLGLKSNKFKIASSSLNKICGRCQLEKPKYCFGKDKHRLDSLNPVCKECMFSDRNKKKAQKATYDKKYRETNHHKLKNYRLKNKDKILSRKRLYNHHYYKIPQNRIKTTLRARVRIALKKRQKTAKTLELLGCPIEQFKSYLESKFLPDMSWKNYGKTGWHIDHIKPCCSFDLTDPQQQRECFHYTNMQPLWAKDNYSKGSKIQTESN